MMFKTHEVAGVVACTAAIPYLASKGVVDNSDLVTVGIVFAGGVLGAMLPDIDSPSSKIRRIIRKTLTGNPHTDKQIINHRRAPHMPIIWAAIFALLFNFVHNPYATTFLIGMAVGVASHLAIDLLNPAGIPLLGPFTRKKVHLMKIYANSTGETIFAWLLVALEAYLLFFSGLQIVSL